MLYEKLVEKDLGLTPMSMLVFKDEKVVEEVNGYAGKPGALERIGKYLSFVTEMIRDEVNCNGVFYGFFDGDDIKILFVKENEDAQLVAYPFKVNVSKVLEAVKEVR
nr:hypothetical protein [Candidatus Baldrarchaeota archaeon]